MNMLRKLSFGVLLIAMGSLPVSANEKILPIGATEWPPFEYSAPDGKSIGTDTEIIEQVIRRMGYTPEMKLQPWKRVEQSGVDGKFAAVYSVLKTPEREEVFYFSDPINRTQQVFFKKKSANIKWKVLGDLKAMHVAVSAGYAYPKVFIDAVKSNQFASVIESFGEAPDLASLRQLRTGSIDLFICEISVCQYLINTHAELKDLDFIDQAIDKPAAVHLAFSKKWPNSAQLVKQFNMELERFVAEGQRKKIFKFYGLASDLK